MNITYILLAITVLVALLSNDKISIWLFVIVTNLIGLTEGIINSESLSYLILLGLACLVYYSYKNIWGKYANFVAFIVIAILAAAFSLHIVPGFSNELAIQKTNLSSFSSPFVMYLNFDKTMAALIIYGTNNALTFSNVLNKRSIRLTIIYLLLCICTVLGPSILMGYVQYDPKIPSILWLWIINNLLFVSMAEEVMFRVFLQTEFKRWLQAFVSLPYLHVILASLIFGIAHYKSGLEYMVLASICGFFYGNIYNKTNAIIYSILIHFSLNLFHILLFTYPSVAVLNISML